jgi:thiamine pyrophosphokinase
MNKALLFLNGKKPNILPKNIELYSIITCTDGAYSRYVKKLPFTVDYISGDLDSVSLSTIPSSIPIIETPDQNKTDFHKALELLLEKGIKKVDIYGGSGRETDHFIGNLSTALFFKKKLRITFYDDYAKFFFSGKITKIRDVKGKIISLLPFFKAKNIYTKGLQYPLSNETLIFPQRLGTRNVAIHNEVSVSYGEGELLIYISQ